MPSTSSRPVRIFSLANAQAAVQRPGAAAARHQQQQQAGPRQVGGPGIRIDEDLDHRRHAQQRQRGAAREQAQHQQQREQVFGIRCQVSGEIGRHQRQAVLLLEQRVGAVLDRKKTADLGAAGKKEDGGDRDPRHQRQQRVADQALRQAGAARPQGLRYARRLAGIHRTRLVHVVLHQ
jgi:hypothetical protein